MENDLDLTNMLDDGDGPHAGADGLRQVVSRHRRRRARQYRIVATSAIVVALAGAGLGVGLDNNGGTRSATGTLTPPPGLKWDGSTGSIGAPTTAPRSQTATVAPATSGPEPGEFGFVASGSGSSASPGALLPVASGTSAGGGYGVTTAKGCAGGCHAVFSPGISAVLFTRHVDGLQITASLVSFSFPVSIHASGIPVRVPATVGSAPTPGSSSGGSVTTTSRVGISGSSSGRTGAAKGSTPISGSSAGQPGSGGGLPIRASIGKAIPFVGACPVASELQVTVSAKGSVETLFVPSGGASDRPFSVVASAAALLPSGGAVVLAVARTSSAVSSVSATFASGAVDSMRPVSGWAVLGELVSPQTDLARADLARAGAVKLVGSSAAGVALETVTLPAAGSLASAPPAPVCRYLVEPLNAVGTASPPTGTVAPGGSGSSGSAPSSGSSTGPTTTADVPPAP